jgi:hypothetical protein
MTAIWTLPRTWATGEIVTAAMLNQYLRDELDYLKARPVARVSDLDGTVSNTTSTTFVDITGATASITTSGSSRLKIEASGVWNMTAGAYNGFITVDIDGVNIGDATNGIIKGYATHIGANAGVWALTFTTTAAVSDAAHTVKLRYRTDNGAATLTIQQFSMTVMEVY